jgi:hypothetical protein
MIEIKPNEREGGRPLDHSPLPQRTTKFAVNSDLRPVTVSERGGAQRGIPRADAQGNVVYGMPGGAVRRVQVFLERDHRPPTVPDPNIRGRFRVGVLRTVVLLESGALRGWYTQNCRKFS